MEKLFSRDTQTSHVLFNFKPGEENIWGRTFSLGNNLNWFDFGSDVSELSKQTLCITYQIFLIFATWCCRPMKGRDRLDMVVKLKVQYCRDFFKDSFETYQTFLQCIFETYQTFLQCIFETYQTFLQCIFKTYQTFLQCIFVQQERKFNLLNPSGLSILQG